MHLLTSLTPPSPIRYPLIFTIGTFDGVHLGHQALLNYVRQAAADMHAKSAVITFSNPPLEVLRPELKTFNISTLDHKIHLLELIKIDYLILLQFTQQFANQSAAQFLTHLKNSFLVKKLILGSDAHLGKNREGDRHSIPGIAKNLNIDVEYFSDYIQDDIRITSSHIRQLIQQGNLSEVQKCLGRPYSIYGKVIQGQGKGAELGFPTANISVVGLCLPPLGVYAITLNFKGKFYNGVANLGYAPTVRIDSSPILEVHLFDDRINLYDEFVDIRLSAYLRPEKKFTSFEELSHQIAQDIVHAKKLLG